MARPLWRLEHPVLLAALAPGAVLAAADIAATLRPFPPHPVGPIEWVTLLAALLGVGLGLGLLLAEAIRLLLAVTPPSHLLRFDLASGIAVVGLGMALLVIDHWFLSRTHDDELGAAGLAVAGVAAVAGAWWLARFLRWILGLVVPPRWWRPPRAPIVGYGLIAIWVLSLAASPWVGLDRLPWAPALALGAAVALWAFLTWRLGDSVPGLGDRVTLLVLGIVLGGAAGVLGTRISGPSRIIAEKTWFTAPVVWALQEAGAASRSSGAMSADDPFPPPAPVADAPRFDPAPNLLLVTLDAVRWDHTSLAGHERDTTPELSRLAERSVVFERAYAPASTTRYSLPSILTGRLPSSIRWRKQGRDLILARGENPSLATVLRARGTRTAAVVNGYNIFLPAFGLDQGFDVYDTTSVKYRTSRVIDGETSSATAGAALRHLEALPKDGPWFLWVHFMDPHAPYQQHAGAPDHGPRDIDRYDSEIAHTDAHLGRLLDATLARPDAARTVIAVTADHGEQFGERGRSGHGRFVTEEEIRVPLVLRIPGVEPRRVTDLAVSAADIVPTMLDLCGALDGAPPLEGRNLLALLRPGAAEPPPVIAETWPYADFHARRVALIAGSRKVRHFVRDGGWSLHDLDADPGELERRPGPGFPEAEQERLKTLLSSWLAAHPLPRHVEERLRGP